MAVIAKTLLTVALLLSLLMLSGCAGGDVTQEVWINSGEKWRVEITLALNADERSMMEGNLDSSLEEAAQEAEANGWSFKWSKKEQDDGSLTYRIAFSGKGFDELSTQVLGGEASIYQDEQGHIHIKYDPSMYTAMLRSYTLIIYGGKIISSNADEETSSSATWYNPLAPIEVELTEKGGSAWILIGVFGACACAATLVLIIGAVVFFVLQRKRRSSG